MGIGMRDAILKPTMAGVSSTGLTTSISWATRSRSASLSARPMVTVWLASSIARNAGAGARSVMEGRNWMVLRGVSATYRVRATWGRSVVGWPLWVSGRVGEFVGGWMIVLGVGYHQGMKGRGEGGVLGFLYNGLSISTYIPHKFRNAYNSDQHFS